MARTLSTIAALLLAWLAAGVATGYKFDGSYELQNLANETGSAIDIPATTTLVLTGESSQRYGLSVSLKKGQSRGNTLGGTARIRAATGSTTVSSIRATRMGTPFLAYEAALARALEATAITTLSADGIILVLKGADMGLMEFRKVSA